MKAVVKTRAESGAEYTDYAEPTPGEGEALVAVKAASICGSDLHIYQWNEWAAGRLRLPQVMGHEMAGEVVALGEGARGVAVGDYVSAETHIPCGECYACRTGNRRVCVKGRIFGVDTDGTFAELVAVPVVDVWHNDSAVPPEVATLQEPLGNAFDTVNAEPVAGKSVLVLGAGPLGLLSVAVARACGAYPIVVSELSPYRRDLAMCLGADCVVDPKSEDVVAVTRERTHGRGAEVVLEVSGAQSALDAGLKALAQAGRVSLIGLPDDRVSVDLNDGVIFKSARVYGITGRHMFQTWYGVSALLESGRLDVTPIITHRLPLHRFEEGFEAMEAGLCGKVVLSP